MSPEEESGVIDASSAMRPSIWSHTNGLADESDRRKDMRNHQFSEGELAERA